ncbi:hypothetical protein POM88_020066 [Heracleum sosnowskyi]|uniref:5'-3' DNA helicase ZGRF1-like N-terminal domain-containing protein n=1 Tax=Heracleum sosnowskyi TaxID=360622 RepID=A0AAD8IC42_9APIA|nr:hypothetical protein POM88_020066 [Heracleum sosnowskyi]
MYRPKFKVKSGSKTDLGVRGSSKNLSPSQKIIRDYKRSERNKYIASPTCPDTPKTSTTEWQVLYTTHLTQKAKKFHDGILKVSECGSQRRQVFLYDENWRLLDSRFLKSDENVRSGESLKLDGHMVDIGNLKGDNEPHEESKLLGGDCVVVRETGIRHQQVQAQTNFHDYRRSEPNKYSASLLDASKTSTSEWQVLYTTQLTQKAKKFHDGILKLSVCGSQKRQVFLYDESGRLLDSRFLKSDENVKSGESLKLDGHLVNVEDLKGDDEALEESKLPGGDCAVAGEIEWDAMYTAQVTQRSKKYHSGIIKLASCGSYRMQATLLAEDGTTLCRRYLKLSEHLSSGSEFQFPSYLVEVGEPRKRHDANLRNGGLVSEDKASLVSRCNVDSVKIIERTIASKFSADELQSKGSPHKEPDPVFTRYRAEKSKQSKETSVAGLQSKESLWKEPDSVIRSFRNEIKPSGEISIKKPLRDVHGILSVLKKPLTQECSISIKREFPEEGDALHTSDIVHIEIQNSVQGKLVDDSRGQCSVLEDSNGDIADIISSHEREDPELKILTSAFSLCDSNKQKPTSTVLTSQIVDDDSGFQPPIVSVMHDGSSAKENINNNQESIFSKESSRFSFGQPLKEVKRKKLSQLSADCLGIGSRSDTASDPCNVDNKNFSTVVTDEFPSFDLGF